MASCKECEARTRCDECAAAFKHYPHAAAERLDLWKMARGALTNEENSWPEDAAPLPVDILHLAMFLEVGAEGMADSR